METKPIRTNVTDRDVAVGWEPRGTNEALTCTERRWHTRTQPGMDVLDFDQQRRNEGIAEQGRQHEQRCELWKKRYIEETVGNTVQSVEGEGAATKMIKT